MAFIRQNSAATSARVTRLVGPVAPRRRRVGAPLGAIQSDADLTRYTNGAPLYTLNGFIKPPAGYMQRSKNGASLNGYESAPDLTQYTNGQPLSQVSGVGTPKAALVIMAFHSAMNKRNAGGQRGGQQQRGGQHAMPMMSAHRNMSHGSSQIMRKGMRGLGDDGSDDQDVQDISDASNAIDSSAQDAASQTYSLSPGGSAPSTPYNGSILSSGSVPMSTVAGSPYGTPTAGSAISNLLSSLFKPAGTTVPAYYSAGSSLASPIMAGSSISTGGALLLGGGVLLLVLMLKKR